VFISRLHVRYDAEHFPEDLVFQETGDRENFQGRYVLRHPWKPDSGERVCDAGRQYLAQLPARQDREAQALASLTGWNIADIRKKMDIPAARGDQPAAGKWWEWIWR